MLLLSPKVTKSVGGLRQPRPPNPLDVALGYSKGKVGGNAVLYVVVFAMGRCPLVNPHLFLCAVSLRFNFVGTTLAVVRYTVKYMIFSRGRRPRRPVITTKFRRGEPCTPAISVQMCKMRKNNKPSAPGFFRRWCI